MFPFSEQLGGGESDPLLTIQDDVQVEIPFMRLKERFWCSYCGGVVKAVQKYTITGDACVSMGCSMVYRNL